MTRCQRIPSYRKAKGFTLVELMIAVTLSLFIAIGLIALYLNIARTNNEMAKTHGQIESGRFASHILQNDIAHGGYWGTYNPKFDNLAYSAVPDDVPNAVPDPCKSFATWTAQDQTNMLGIPVQTYEDVPTSCAALLVNKLANTDILVVRHAEVCLPGATNCEALDNNKLYFQSSLNSSCAGAPTYPTYVMSNVSTAFTLTNRGCTALAPRRKVITHIYYVRDFAITADDGVPTLVRSELDYAGATPTLAQQPPVPLIEGIEGFRVEVGVDSLSKTGAAVDYTAAVAWVNAVTQVTATNRGDGAVDGEYVRCTTTLPCTAAQLMNVVALKVFVLARTREATPGFTDGKTYQLASSSTGPTVTPGDNFKRHLFNNTIRLVNVSGRRETP